MNPTRPCLLAGALFGATGVALGAWGAHGLAAFLGRTDVGAWDTAVQYQLIHALALIGVGILAQLCSNANKAPDLLSWVGYLMIAGVVLFSGSIYGLMLGGPRWLGPVTPLGGVCFIVAWSLLVLVAHRWREA